MHNRLVSCAVLACFSVLGYGQTAQAPKPSPELQRLDYFAGKMSCEGVTKSDNAKSAGTMQCAWFKGGFALECRAHFTVPTEGTGVYVYGYSTAEKAYTLYSYGSTGSWPGVRKGQRQGTTWTFDREGTYSGKPAKYQLVMTEDSPVKSGYQWRRSVEGGPWTVTSEGSCTKENR